MAVHSPEQDWSTEFFGFLYCGPKDVSPVDFFEFLFIGVWFDEGEVVVKIIGVRSVIWARGYLGG